MNFMYYYISNFKHEIYSMLKKFHVKFIFSKNLTALIHIDSIQSNVINPIKYTFLPPIIQQKIIPTKKREPHTH